MIMMIRKSQKEIHEVTWSAEAAEKGGYPHFMLKEIYEQPKAIHDTVQIYLNKDGSVNFKDLGWTEDCFDDIDHILITACGTAYHAGLVAKHYIERFVRIRFLSKLHLNTDTAIL